MKSFKKMPPHSKKKLSTNYELEEKLNSLIGMDFNLTGKPRTDGVYLQNVVQKTLGISECRGNEPTSNTWAKRKGMPTIGGELLYVYLATPPYANEIYNLQMWNVNIHDLEAPIVLNEDRETVFRMKDTRVMIAWSDRELNCIQDITLLSMEELLETYSPSKTKTIKKQAIIPKSFREDSLDHEDNIVRLGDMPNKKEDIKNYNKILGSPNKELFKAFPDRKTVLTLNYMAEKLNVLLNQKVKGADVRTRSKMAERMVLHALGYDVHEDTALTGFFPDVPHQLLEVKLQNKNTICLGQYTPYTEKALPLVGYSTKDIRYCILFTNDKGVIESIFLMDSTSFSKQIHKVEAVNYKFQLRIPESDSKFKERRRGYNQQLVLL